MRYMLDTNICIYLIKNHPPQVLRRLEVLKQGDAVMSVVTYAELRAGLEIQGETRSASDRDGDKHALALLINRIPVLPFMESDAVSFGVLRAAVRDRNRDTMDRLIAAHAVSTKVTLVTNNEADFKDYPSLVIENWASNISA
jgi:tRNA(fMet)-specific endonuclease VapC